MKDLIKKVIKSLEENIHSLNREINSIQGEIKKLKELDLSKYSNKTLVIDGRWDGYGYFETWCLFTKVAEEKMNHLKDNLGNFTILEDEDCELFYNLQESEDILALDNV